MLKRIITHLTQTQQQRDDAEFAAYLENVRTEQIADHASVCDLPRTAPLTIFLDFDGVLHPGNNASLRELPRIESLMRRYPFDVVITSNWRIGTSMAGLREYFSTDLRHQVVGKTVHLENSFPSHTRYHEIREFCSEHPVSAWIALDDQAVLFPPNTENPFLVDPD